jgi:hypothetical protein
VRIRLHERTARWLQENDLPRLDRRLAFTLVRGKHSAVRADSLAELRRILTGPPPSDQGRGRRARKHRRKL